MRFIRVGICCLLAFAVLAFGATEEWSQAVLEVGSAVLLVVWAVRQYRKKTEYLSIPPEFVPLCAFALVVVLQLVFHLTASRYSTRIELQLLTTYLTVVFLMSQAFSRKEHWRAFVWFVMSLGFFVSIFAILQSFTFNGKIYWFRVMRFGGLPFGPYVNRNHFAGFAEMVIPFALVPLVLGKVRRERLFLVALFAVVPIVALLLSASRGGIVSFVVQMVILFLLLIIRRVRGTYVMIGGMVVLSAVMAVSWIGFDQVLTRFAGIQNLEVSAGKRAAMRRDTWRIFLDHRIIGTGLGTLQMIYPPYDSVYDGKIVNHAHNDYLEGLAETGLLGGLCCLWFLGALLQNALKGMAALGGSFGSVLNLSGLVACSGILVHSLVDFNLHIPANALLFFVSAHMAAARLQPTFSGAAPVHRRGEELGNTVVQPSWTDGIMSPGGYPS
jgi:O-antigen ligase